jgi:hypothetical protein
MQAMKKVKGRVFVNWSRCSRLCCDAFLVSA